MSVRMATGAVLWACACVGAPPAPPEHDVTTAEPSSSGTPMGASTAASAETGGTGGASSEPTSESTSAIADGHPVLVISDSPTYDFGSLDLTETTAHPFSIFNAGEGDATSLQLAVEGTTFVITSHDCSDVLAVGAACEVLVSFEPARFGDVQGELEVAYHDQGMATSVARAIVGRGVGTTANLLVNGGGELGDATDVPPMGWTIGYGPSWSASSTAVTPVEGARTIFAGWGPPGSNDFTLSQTIDGASLTTWGDAAGVRFSYRAYHRAEASGDDPTWLRLRFRDAGGAEITIHPSSPFSGASWNESTDARIAPIGTHQVELELACDRLQGDVCSGHFDGLELWAEWPG